MLTSKLFAQLPAIALLNAGIAAISSIIVARAFGPSIQGIFVALVATAAVVALCVGSGTGITVRLEAAGKPSLRDASNFFWFSILAASVAAAAGGVYVKLAFPGLTDLETFLSVFLFFTFTLTTQYAEFTQALGKLALAVFSPFVYSAAVGVGAIFAMVANDQELWMVLVGACAGQSVQFAILARTAGREYGRLPLTPVPRNIVGLSTRSMPALGWNLGMVILQRGLRVVLPFVAPSTTVGLIGAASVLAEMQRVVPNALARIVFVELSTEKSWTARAKRATLLATGIVLVSAVGLLLLGPLAIEILFGKPYTGATKYLPWLVALELLMSLAMVAGRAAIGLGKVRQMAALFLSASVVVCLLAMLLGGRIEPVVLIAIFACGNVAALTGGVLLSRVKAQGESSDG